MSTSFTYVSQQLASLGCSKRIAAFNNSSGLETRKRHVLLEFLGPELSPETRNSSSLEYAAL